VDPLIASAGSIAGLMIEAESFPGWRNFGALVSHLRFVIDHHRNIERIAIVTDSGLLKVLLRVAAYFVKPTIRRFAPDEKAGALAWLEIGRSHQ
jgi:SpoIIAA-like